MRLLIICASILFLNSCGTTEKSKTEASVKDILTQNKSEFESCGKEEKKKNMKLNGKVILSWDITNRGNVENITVASNTTENDDLALCLKDKVGGLIFPTTSYVKKYNVKFPFVYSE